MEQESKMSKVKITVVDLPLKCKKCAMRRHRVGLVKKCEYICPENSELQNQSECEKEGEQNEQEQERN